MNHDAKILKTLRDAGENGISTAELSQATGLGRSALSARVKDLRALGYNIESSPYQGLRLQNSPDALIADDLISRLGKAKVIGRDVRVFQETSSTNDVVEKLARDGVREGVTVFAESQTRGRGRLGRKWASPLRKGLWFSVLLRPKLRPQEATQLTVASATALRRAIEKETRLHPVIKWPNDILLSGRKTAGILTELHAELDQIQYAILGIGVDVNLSPADFPTDVRKTATSLSAELGGPVSRCELAAAILLELDKEYARISSGKFEAVADEWEDHCATLGNQIVIRTGQRELRGRAESLDADGALLLRTEHGHIERIVGGDVTLEMLGREE